MILNTRRQCREQFGQLIAKFLGKAHFKSGFPGGSVLAFLDNAKHAKKHKADLRRSEHRSA